MYAKLLTFISAGIGLFYLVLTNLSKPPVDKFENFHIVINEAYDYEAFYYASKLYAEAVVFCEIAYKNWRFENKKPWYKRDYSDLDIILNLAISAAEEAKDKSIKEHFAKEMQN